VYAAAAVPLSPAGQGTVAILDRATTGTVGALSQAAATSSCVSNDVDGPGGNPPGDPECDGAHAMGGPFALAISGDGRSAYVAAGNGALDVFDRSTGTGALTQLGGPDGCLEAPPAADGCTPTTGLGAPAFLWSSPDDRSLYSSAPESRAIVALQRERAPSCGDATAKASGVVIVGLACDEPNGEPVTFAIAQSPAHGKLGAIDQAQRTVAYTPTPGYTGTDGFTFTGTDGANASAPATVGITVTAPAPPPTARVTITRVSMLRRRFAVGRATTPTVAARRRKVPTGTAFRFTLSARSAVTILIERVLPGRRVKGRCVTPSRRNRKAKACTRYVKAGTLRRRSMKAGADSVAFSGRIGKVALKPGSYRATLTAKPVAGKTSLPRSVKFTVVAGR
jgi:hypothetical protein